MERDPPYEPALDSGIGKHEMTFRNPGLALILMVLSSSQAISAQTAESAASDKNQVVQTVETIFKAASKDDLALFDSVIAPGFYLFDSGVRFDGDSLMPVIKQLHAAGKRFEWHVTNPDVHISGSMAWLAYVNNGVITNASVTTKVRWLESAVLTRTPSGWKLVFMHSTLVPPQG